jgi:acyl-CoA synthetase (NDP forming)
VGASSRLGSFGERVITNLREFSGSIFLVNPRYERIGDQTCHPDLASLPDTPDCVVVATPASEVERVVLEAVTLGVGGVIVFASGFAETGRDENIDRQQRLAELVGGTRTRLIGPNCIGIFNHVAKAQMSFTIIGAPEKLRRPAIGVVSQSGALGTAVSQAAEHGVSITHTLTAGNSCDVDVADLVAYLAEDERCDAIACMFEGLAQPKRLMEAAERARSNGKPVIVYKMATGATGAAAAMSHTGALAGSNVSYAAAFERAGIVQVNAIEDLIETTVFFAKAPKTPLAKGVAIVSVSGGAGIIAADKAEAHGVLLPVFSTELKSILAGLIPDFGSPINPCDVTAELLKKPEMLAVCANAILSEPTVGAIIYPHPFARDGATERMTILADAAKRHGKVFCVVWLTEYHEGPGAREVEENSEAILFRSMDRCLAALKAWHKRGQNWDIETERTPLVSVGDRERVMNILALSPERVIGEAKAKMLLSLYGIAVVQEKLVTTLQEALAASTELGFPLAMKIESPDILHKTEAGMVFLDIATTAALELAFSEIMAKAAAMQPRPRMNGIVIQPMVRAGLEFVIGGRRDPMFGPLLVFGFGGTLVELLRDSVVALAPVSTAEAIALLPRLGGYALLSGYRNSPVVDLKRLGSIIARVSEFLANHSDMIDELDINPLIATPHGLVAVDALIVRPPILNDSTNVIEETVYDH